MPYLLIDQTGFVHVMKLYDNVSVEDEIAKQSLQVVEIREVAELPPYDDFRNAWRYSHESGVRHCMPTARDIQRDKLRAHRSGRFTQTDVAIATGLADGLDTSAVSGMVKRLRDVTKHPAIEAAQNIHDLAKVWPSVLDEPVPALGGPRISGDADYDTKALEQWAQSLTDKIAEQTKQISALQAQRETQPAVDLSDLQSKLSDIETKLGGAPDGKDIQIIAQAAHDMGEKLKALQERVVKAEEDSAYALKHAIVDARLTEDKLQ